MWDKLPILRALATLTLFILLQGVSLFFVSQDSLFQRVKVAGVFMHIKSGIAEFTSDIKYYTGLKSINETLAAENIKLKNELERLNSIYSKVDSSYTMTPPSPSFTYIPAKIIANSTNKLHNYLIIDRGKKDGISRDMGVVSPNGVVGVISSVAENYSYVISFLNINQSVSAKIAPSQAFGPLVWEGRRPDYATLTEVPYHINFMIGDTVYTSGFSTLFPPDIPLGTVRKSTVIKGSHHQIQVKLFQDFSTLHFVNVVVNNNKPEIDQIKRQNEN